MLLKEKEDQMKVLRLRIENYKSKTKEEERLRKCIERHEDTRMGDFPQEDDEDEDFGLLDDLGDQLI